MSTGSNPFEELERLFERMSRQYDEASQRWEQGDTFGRLSSGTREMALDLVEHDDEYVMTVDVPGFSNDEVDVRISGQTLRIEAEHEEAVDEESDRYVRHERQHRSMERALELPDGVDRENVDARMRNGVLTVTLPKVETGESRRIEIE
ncbi:Hsp20/alpha crystallin family protein [Haloarchaeobius sp. HRN-SO-5]|uniref:Hsp20/alpha crystallin family protein n=1 Tax=Haloarchaeobius sp. HRN-SO-5 TaxID=3446118 RepID=UPI003EBBD842